MAIKLGVSTGLNIQSAVGALESDHCPLDEQAERIVAVLDDCLKQVELLTNPEAACPSTAPVVVAPGLTRRLDLAQDLANDLQKKLIALRTQIGTL